MKEKFESIINDDKKRIVLIVFIVLIISIAVIAISYLVLKIESNNDKPEETTIVTTTKKTRDPFYYYEDTNVEFESNVSYDLESKHIFKYSDNKKDTIKVTNDDLELYYEVSIKEGKLLFVEMRYVQALKGREYTGKSYTYTNTNAITNFVIGHSCEEENFELVIKDARNNIYNYKNTLESNKSIKEVINSITKVKTISTVSEIGYYTHNNSPFITCSTYTMVYKDTVGNIRLLDSKNTLFYNTAYYEFIGKDHNDQVVYVFKDGRMKYDIGNTSYLNDGDYAIYYKGSFYVDNNNTEDLYIIDRTGFLYKIENLNENSSPIIKKYSTSKISKIGTQLKNEKNKEYNIYIRFEDDSNLELKSIYNLEIIK